MESTLPTHDERGNRIIGFSWPHKDKTSGRKDPRERVCRNCIRPDDQWDVAIIGVAKNCKPVLCRRCWRPLSFALR